MENKVCRGETMNYYWKVDPVSTLNGRKFKRENILCGFKYCNFPQL